MSRVSACCGGIDLPPLGFEKGSGCLLGRLFCFQSSVGMNSVACPASRFSPVPLDQDLSALLSHWLDMAILNRPVSMHPPTPVVMLMTDASLFDRSCLLLPHRVDAAWVQDLVAFSVIGWAWGPFTCLFFTSPSFPGEVWSGSFSQQFGPGLHSLSGVSVFGAPLLPEGCVPSLLREARFLLWHMSHQGGPDCVGQQGSRDMPVSSGSSIDLATFVWNCSLSSLSAGRSLRLGGHRLSSDFCLSLSRQAKR